MALYLTDYVSALIRELSMLTHTWSLAVEEHFYLIWPPLLMLVAKRGRGAGIRLLVVMFAVATLCCRWADLRR